jgi:hypothetical protein
MGGSGSKSYLSGSNKPTKTKVSPPVSGGNTAQGGEGGSGGGGGGGDVCAIVTSGTLRSPNPPAVSTLTIGTELALRTVGVNGVDVLQAVNTAGDVVGVVDTPEEQQLIDCIFVGNRYRATVMRISGGAVSVRISRI